MDGFCFINKIVYYPGSGYIIKAIGFKSFNVFYARLPFLCLSNKNWINNLNIYMQPYVSGEDQIKIL